MQLRFRIFRFNPSEDRGPYFRTYEVYAEKTERILDCLNRIKWEQDGALTYRHSCAHGVCGSDAVRINGVCALACRKLVQDYAGAEVLVEPLPGFKVLKDLVVDMTDFFDKVQLVRPYLAAHDLGDRERLQSPEDRGKIDYVVRCILCACCMGACPEALHRPEFIGPAPLVQAFRRIFDSRDEERDERLRRLDTPDGVWGCLNHFECTKVCPKDIPVTKSINAMKRLLRA
jgi:succinate dehydrogenase / fumarate reductase, iron-sulfur subunit